MIETNQTNQTNQTPELNPDFASQNPLEYDLFRKEAGLELITPNQYRFIRQFQKAFLKHKEQKCTSNYEVKPNIRTKTNKQSDPIADIAETSLPYLSYLNKYGDRNIRIIEEWFCGNRTLKNLKEKYTEKKTEIRTVTKTKKNGKTKTKEIEVIREYFHEMELWDDLYDMVEILDKITAMREREEERGRRRKEEKELWSKTEGEDQQNEIDGEDKEIIKKLNDKIRIMGKVKVANHLKISYRQLERIVDGYDGYPYKTYKNIKMFLW
jgi:hypothetical protein